MGRPRDRRVAAESPPYAVASAFGFTSTWVGAGMNRGAIMRKTHREGKMCKMMKEPVGTLTVYDTLRGVIF